MARRLTTLLGALASPRRRAALAALVLGVAAVHGCVTHHMAERMAELGTAQAMPARIEVAYVREMALSTPPPTAAAAAPPAVESRAVQAKPPESAASAAAALARKAERERARALARERARDAARELDREATHQAARRAVEVQLAGASAARDAEAASEAAAPFAQANAPVAPTASAATPAASAVAEGSGIEPQVAATPAAGAAVASSAANGASVPTPVLAVAAGEGAAFEWPTSTRVSYLLTGNYNGDVSGSAQVEWIRSGSRYQVHLDLVVGPSAAPIVTRRMSSDGEITAAGLAPRRYDQDTKVVLRERRRATIAFEADGVVLANGNRAAAVAGVQDTASQFVQLTYVFSTRPEMLRAGGSVDIPLALPHRVGVWTYDVVGEELLHTPFGPLPSIHLKPRKAPQRPNELVIEMWFAPQLRYLPARIRITQDAGNFVDLTISKRPDVAG